MNESQQTLDEEKLQYITDRSEEVGRELHLINLRFDGNFEKVAHEIGRILAELEFTAKILNEQVEHLLNAHESGAQSMRDGTDHFTFRCDEHQDSISVLTQRINRLEVTGVAAAEAVHNQISELEAAVKPQPEKTSIPLMPKKGDTKP